MLVRPRMVSARVFASPLPQADVLRCGDAMLSRCLSDLMTAGAKHVTGLDVSVEFRQIGPDPYHVGSVLKVIKPVGLRWLSVQLLRGDFDAGFKKTGSGREIAEHTSEEAARMALFGEEYRPKLGNQIGEVASQIGSQVEDTVQNLMAELSTIQCKEKFLSNLHLCARRAIYLNKHFFKIDLEMRIDECSKLTWNHLSQPGKPLKALKHIRDRLTERAVTVGQASQVLQGLHGQLEGSVKALRDANNQLPLPEFRPELWPAAKIYHALRYNCQHDCKRVFDHVVGEFERKKL